MIQLLPQLKILLAYQPVDFRKGLDGLIGLCRDHLNVEIYVSFRQSVVKKKKCARSLAVALP